MLDTSQESISSIRRHNVGLLQGLSLLLVCATLAMFASTASLDSRAATASTASRLVQRWGVVIEGVRETAAGFALDFRYRVVDATKAATLFMRSNTPYMLDQASGKAVSVVSGAIIGPLRSSQTPTAGHTYVIIFSNPRGLIRPGAKVSVIIGDFKAENLVVE